MSKSNRILAIVQILIIVSLMLCNGGVSENLPDKSEIFPCKAHQCGCKTEYDCKTHCCCANHENSDTLDIQNNTQGNSFRAFVSSINCKYGSESFKSIDSSVKYMFENSVKPLSETFLCFLPHNSSIRLPEAFVSPPEKPPRFFI